MKYRTIELSALWVACALLCSGPAQAVAVAQWDATADFSASASTQVNGVWSYGSAPTLGGAFTAFTTSQLTSGQNNTELRYWNSASSFAYLGKAGATGYLCCRSVDAAANALSLHAGFNGELAVMRFTAPSAGTYQVDASFWGQDYVRPAHENVDVHVRTAGADLFSASVVGFGSTSARNWNGSVTLAANQTLDFMVGRGADNFFGYGSTGMSGAVSLSPVPEPAAAVLMLLGLMGLGGQAALRRRAH